MANKKKRLHIYCAQHTLQHWEPGFPQLNNFLFPQLHIRRCRWFSQHTLQHWEPGFPQLNTFLFPQLHIRRCRWVRSFFDQTPTSGDVGKLDHTSSEPGFHWHPPMCILRCLTGNLITPLPMNAPCYLLLSIRRCANGHTSGTHVKRRERVLLTLHHCRKSETKIGPLAYNCVDTLRPSKTTKLCHG